jgi:hypothetical protein
VVRICLAPPRLTVAEAIKALEDAGVLSWVRRPQAGAGAVPDLLGDDGWRWRVLRTSNAYNFRDPGAPNSSKANFQSGTPNQAYFSSFKGRLRRRKDRPERAGRASDREGVVDFGANGRN